MDRPDPKIILIVGGDRRFYVVLRSSRSNYVTPAIFQSQDQGQGRDSLLAR